MSLQRVLQSAPRPAQQPQGRTHRAYTIAQLCRELGICRADFYRLRESGQFPAGLLVELLPRLGRLVRYKADPIDRWFAGQWNQPRSFRSHLVSR